MVGLQIEFIYLFFAFYFGFNIGIRVFTKKKPRSVQKHKEMTFVLLFALFTLKAFVAIIRRRYLNERNNSSHNNNILRFLSATGDTMKFYLWKF